MRSWPRSSAQNLAAPVGRLLGVYDERTIRLEGRLESPEEFTHARRRQSRRHEWCDWATSRRSTWASRSRAPARTFTGKAAVGIDIKKSKGYSTTQLASAIRDAIGELQKTAPAGVTLSIVRDAGKRVANSVENVEGALIEGAVLTVLTVFLFLNSWRSTVITGLALPVSVIASFVAVLACGFTLNTMSLLGLSLAIGILIDDAIVVRENIVRHVEQGKDHFTAAHDGHVGNRPGGRGDHVLDRRGLRADRVHGRRGAAVDGAVRADDCVLGARVAVRLVLARPDAVGLLARPAPPDAGAVVALARARIGSTGGSTGRRIATRRSSAGPSVIASR